MLTTDFKSMKLSKSLSKTAVGLAISRSMPRKTLMAIAASSCIAAPDARATIYNVSETSTCSLSDAVKAANTNEEVLSELVSEDNVICEAGSAGQTDVINLLSDITFNKEDMDQPGNAVRFVSSQITINGNGFTLSRDAPNSPNPDMDPNSRNFRFTAVTSGTTEQPSHLTLRNLTFSGGYLSGFNGGALFVSSSASLTLNNVVLDGNHVAGADDEGGAIYSKGAVLINNSTISNNTAGRAGGGIYASQDSSGGTFTLTNSTVSGNSAGGRGGGIYSRSTNRAALMNSTLTNSAVSDNLSSGEGGGISAIHSNLTLTNSTMSGNSVSGNSFSLPELGGGISALASSVTLSNSTVSGNSASVRGGGIYAGSTSHITLSNSTVSGNSADAGGGIEARYRGNVTLTNSTVSGNSASRNGGGIYGLSGNFTLTNSTVSGNSANLSGGEIYARVTGGIGGNSVTLTNNLLGDNAKTTAQAFHGFMLDATTNIIATSDGNQPTALANILSPLANNGGPTQTHALPQGSPAVDAGLNSICNTAPISRLDQRGYLRTGACDIGAFEFGASLPPPFRPATIVPAINLLLDDEE